MITGQEKKKIFFFQFFFFFQIWGKDLRGCDCHGNPVWEEDGLWSGLLWGWVDYRQIERHWSGKRKKKKKRKITILIKKWSKKIKKMITILIKKCDSTWWFNHGINFFKIFFLSFFFLFSTPFQVPRHYYLGSVTLEEVFQDSTMRLISHSFSSFFSSSSS